MNSLNSLNSLNFKEVDINREASDYLLRNVNIIRRRYGNKGAVDDLINDVYYSLYTAEDEGNGYDSCIGTTVEQFVNSRLKKYSLNKKYTSGVEVSRLGIAISASIGYDEGAENISSFERAYMLASDDGGINSLIEHLEMEGDLKLLKENEKYPKIKEFIERIIKNADDLLHRFQEGEIDSKFLVYLSSELGLDKESNNALKSVLRYILVNR